MPVFVVFSVRRFARGLFHAERAKALRARGGRRDSPGVFAGARSQSLPGPQVLPYRRRCIFQREGNAMEIVVPLPGSDSMLIVASHSSRRSWMIR